MGLTIPPEVKADWLTNRQKYPFGERRGPFSTILVSILLALTLTIVGARLWARCKVRRNAGLDDWLIVAALVKSTSKRFYQFGVDRHAWEVTATQAVNFRIVTWAISIFYILVTSLVKTSILCFYRRLSEGMTNTWLFIIYGSIVFVVVYAILVIVMACVACHPMDAFWNKMDAAWTSTHRYKCFDEGAGFLASAIVSVTQDAMVCILPLIVLFRLQMPRKQKLALAGIFGVGFFLCACGIMRAASICKVYYQTYDSTWEALPAWEWTLVEIHFAIICASAPALKLFFHRVLKPSTDGSYTGGRQRQDYGHLGSSKQGTDSTRGDAAISMHDMLAYEEAATPLPSPTNGRKSTGCRS
ncbi:uncharacterized protein K452DRAFT_341398 [Aplosporella prunicola CBS 121167]|uniref:Rhodopsin domain-containing protein n=1 Tax=Aplosporella prunicola CBS 121167 TaxID=1176127 RepID=A0A6A6B1Q3_9PEZI|nr:uncharacterized protein K452DRAFT_341398 [Aplosporella prunicola CBS 121167]KAF2137195.1 hypothetical protein K452DRAFT_341398 [Aplosporella prunicola CBS 121167]